MRKGHSITFPGERGIRPPLHVAPGLDELVTAIRAAVSSHADWRQTARLVAGQLRRRLPSPDVLTVEQRLGDPETYRSHPLHTEPDGAFSIVALVWRPGQVTPIHDHVTWCVFGVVQGLRPNCDLDPHLRHRRLPDRVKRPALLRPPGAARPIGSTSVTEVRDADALRTEEEDQVGRIVVTEFVSLDGVMEDPGGSEDFEHGGWTFAFDRGDEGDEFKLDETLESEALLLGRVTYEGFAAAWPSREGEFADKFNSMPKYVVSSTLGEAVWNNSTVFKGDVVEEISKLREELDGDIVVHGSARLVQTLVEHDLVDELRLMIFPVVLGSGKRLFGDTSDKKRLRLVDSKVVGDGVAILIYERAGVESKRSDSD